ncbi:RING finger protein 44 [Plakobranchus ocellatus]|uniref:RING finger protein 44 n=1 Tax=Plakobranchus ocellatus TaxID=259542 RepID=A0AAV4DJK6_9GAST|nr:RING finger protein 44 [Plakobranchus ocellatus]
MDNQRRNRQGTSPNYLEENSCFHSSHALSPARGSNPRGHRSYHQHHRAETGPQYQTWGRHHSHHLHTGPHYRLQMSTQNSQRRFHSTGSFQVLPPAFAPMFQRAFPNAGRPSAQRQHQRSHRRTFQQPRNNRNQPRAIGHQLIEGVDIQNIPIRLEDENGAAAMQPSFHHHHPNRRPHHRRGRDHRRTLSQPQNPQEAEAQAVPTESSGQSEAIVQPQTLPPESHNLLPAQTQPLPDNRQGHEVNFQIILEDENAATAIQLDVRHHRRNRHRHHRRGHNHHLPAASYPRSAQTQSQPQNSQQPQVQPASTESTGQREAMAQTQPLPSDRRARTQSHSVSSQELSVQPTPSNSVGEHEAMATQQSLISQPDNRHGDGSLPHGNHSQQPNTISQDREGRLRMAQMVLRRLLLGLPQRTSDVLDTSHENLLQLPIASSGDRLDKYLDKLMWALRSVLERPQEANYYQEQFYEFERLEYSAAEHYTNLMLQNNAAAIQNNIYTLDAHDRIEMVRHLAEKAQHYAIMAHNFAAVIQHVAEASPHAEIVTQHIGAATHHIAAALQHYEASRQHEDAVRQRTAIATHNNVAETQSNVTATTPSDNDIQRLANIQLNSNEDVGDFLDDIGQIPDYHSSPDNGLSVDKIQEIPTRQFSRGAEHSGSDQTSCVFCICDFEDKQLLRILPCFHEFHAECVDEWLKTNRTCPLCRHDLADATRGLQ